MILIAFIYGFLAAAAALFLEVFFEYTFSLPLPPISIPLFFLAASIEEGAKFLFLLQLGRRFPGAFSLGRALAFGLGFAAVELFLVSTRMSIMTPTPLFGIVVVHVSTVLFLFLGIRSYGSWSLAPWLALASVTVLHTTYNVFL